MDSLTSQLQEMNAKLLEMIERINEIPKDSSTLGQKPGQRPGPNTNHDICIEVLNPYVTNKNTGNIYEIVCILRILRISGFADDEFYSNPILTQIRQTNPKFTEQIQNKMKSIPLGDGYFLEGQRVVNFRNTTQDDEDGGTGDLVMILEDGSERSVSITEGSVTKKEKIKKCLINPSCTRFECTIEMIEEFNRIASVAVEEYKAEMTEKYGPDKDSWPSRIKTNAQKKAVSQVTEKVKNHFNSLPKETKSKILRTLLRIDNDVNPADYLAFVHKTNHTFTLWKWGSLKINTEDFELNVKGDYLQFIHKDTGCEIGETQVKFNNGIYKKDKKGKWKTSSLTSSWNGGFKLSECFEFERAMCHLVPNSSTL